MTSWHHLFLVRPVTTRPWSASFAQTPLLSGAVLTVKPGTVRMGPLFVKPVGVAMVPSCCSITDWCPWMS